MIVKMKKISLVTLASDKDRALEGLRKIGIMHLDLRDTRSPDLDELLHSRANTERAIFAISQLTQEGDPPETEADAAISRILEIEEQQRNYSEESDLISRDRERLVLWGDFEPGEFDTLKEKGVSIKLYTLSKEGYKAVSDRSDLYVIYRDKANVGVAVVDGVIEGLQETLLPEKSLSSLNQRSAEIGENRLELAAELQNLAGCKTKIEEKLARIDQAITFERAKLSMDEESGLTHISGFVPEPKVNRIQAEAGKHSWALLIQEPEDDDTVPILLKNKKPVRIISPLFDLFGTLPGYHEYDISFWFLLFFTLFFAMIIGDAGYGFIFLGITLAVILKKKSNGKPAGRELMLFTVLSLAAIVWGALSGTWFGSQAIAQAIPFRYLVLEPISSFNPRSSETVKYFCFVIGAVQILLAHGWNFITQLKQKPRIKAFGQFGWMMLVFGAFFLVLNLVLDPIAYPIPGFALYLIGGGLAFVVMFSEQEGKFFKGLAKGLASLFPTFLDSISAFADVISYIRLFAVGLATVEIAKAFNAMAADMGGSVVGIIGAILVLAVGHGLNLAMGAMSVVVHGVRLNMLEFSGHLGMEWTGVAYTPFSSGIEEPAQIEDQLETHETDSVRSNEK